METTFNFFYSTPIITILLLLINYIFAVHNPYMAKKTPFECGIISFWNQNRIQFSISFFIFGLLFLLFDLEVILVYPFLGSSYTNEIDGLVKLLGFLLFLILGFGFELGKNALNIESRQNKESFDLNNLFNKSGLFFNLGELNIPKQNFVVLQSNLFSYRPNVSIRNFSTTAPHFTGRGTTSITESTPDSTESESDSDTTPTPTRPVSRSTNVSTITTTDANASGDSNTNTNTNTNINTNTEPVFPVFPSMDDEMRRLAEFASQAHTLDEKQLDEYLGIIMDIHIDARYTELSVRDLLDQLPQLAVDEREKLREQIEKKEQANLEELQKMKEEKERKNQAYLEQQEDLERQIIEVSIKNRRLQVLLDEKEKEKEQTNINEEQDSLAQEQSSSENSTSLVSTQSANVNSSDNTNNNTDNSNDVNVNTTTNTNTSTGTNTNNASNSKVINMLDSGHPLSDERSGHLIAENAEFIYNNIEKLHPYIEMLEKIYPFLGITYKLILVFILYIKIR